MRRCWWWFLTARCLVFILCSTPSSACEFDFWVFRPGRCAVDDIQTPDDSSMLITDGECRWIGNNNNGNAAAAAFPGYYRATCSGSKINFIVSGCRDAQCTDCSGVDPAVPETLYMDITNGIDIYPLRPTTGTPFYYGCGGWTSHLGVSIYYAAYGTCSVSACPSTATTSTAQPTQSPVVASIMTTTSTPTRGRTAPTTRAPTPSKTVIFTVTPQNEDRPDDVTNNVIPPPPEEEPHSAIPPTTSAIPAPEEEPNSVLPSTTADADTTDASTVSMPLNTNGHTLDAVALDAWARVTASHVALQTNVPIQLTEARSSSSNIVYTNTTTIQAEAAVVSSAEETPAPKISKLWAQAFSRPELQAQYVQTLSSAHPSFAQVELLWDDVQWADDDDNDNDDDDKERTSTTQQPLLLNLGPLQLVLAAVGAAAIALAALLALFMVCCYKRRRQRKRKQQHREKAVAQNSPDTEKTGKKKLQVAQSGNVEYTHDIFVSVERSQSDELSTLGGYTGMAGTTSKEEEDVFTIFDDPTASVNADVLGVVKKQNDNEGDQSVFVSTVFSHVTALQKMFFDDEKSFEQQFQEPTNNSIAQDVVVGTATKTFGVVAPPGRLGVVFASDTLGSAPVVQAIREDSILAEKGVRTGDRLLYVDGLNVADRTARAASDLISQRSSAPQRSLVFSRTVECNID